MAGAMAVKVQRLRWIETEDGILDPIPIAATQGSAGMDLMAAIEKPITLGPGQCELIPTGIALELLVGMAALVIPRSGLGHKHGIVLGNCLGLIDSDYRGEVMVSAWNRTLPGPALRPDGSGFHLGWPGSYTIRPGERLAQLLIVPTPAVKLEEAEMVSSTARGAGGFGSTGRA